MDNKARAREDYTLYRAMLKTIRKTEENYQDDSHIIFIIQVMDCIWDYKGIIGINYNKCMNLKGIVGDIEMKYASNEGYKRIAYTLVKYIKPVLSLFCQHVFARAILQFACK